MEDREPYITGGKMRDKYLTEAMGFCYHTIEAAETFPRYGCSKCGLDVDDCIDNDFSMWEDFGRLWEWAIDQEWWDDLEKEYDLPRRMVPNVIIHPERFAQTIYEYMQNKVDKESK